jgi:glycosyltransferase involved in cell wall biosynthesis
MLCDVDFSFPDATRTHSVEVARGFARAGLAVDLVARGPDPSLTGVTYTRADGAEHQKLRRLATINDCAIGVLWRRRRSADRFYVRDNWSCFPAILTARALGYRVVVQVDGIPYGGVSDDVPPVLDLVKRAVAIAIGRLSQGQLAVTPQIKSLLVDLARVPPERVAVIGNGVDLDFFAPLPRGEAIARLGLDLDRRYLVFCGGFHPWTDFDAILEAFAAVRAVHPETHLVLVGDGPERPAIEAHAARLGIGDGFTITGMLGDRERVRDFLAAATITLLAYRPERVGVTSASPIKLTEYLSMGRAVVAVEIPGVRELVEETGAGIVIDDGAPAMTSAILELLSGDCADRCGAAGRAVAEARLSWQSVIDRTLSLFDR